MKIAASLGGVLAVAFLYALGRSNSSPAGAACSEGSDCEGDVCLNSPDFPSGYRTQACTVGSNSGCPGGSVCIDDASGTPSGSGIKSVCYQACAVDADCGAGYACKEKAGQRVCKK